MRRFEHIYRTNDIYHSGVRGMKWGIRRYQNADGTLTDAGKKRYDRDQRENDGKNKGDKVVKADPNRWVKEDLIRSRKITKEASGLTNNLKTVNDNAIKNKPKAKMDLSNMTDKEMRDRINREILERQYNDMFAPKKSTKGREYVSKVLETAGSVLAVTSSALGIALAIREFKG